MAYDENGNYYLDYEEQELYNDEMKREEIRDVVKAQRKAQQAHTEANQIWFDSLKAEGLDPQTYQQLYEADPDLAKDLLKSGMKSFAAGIKRGRDPNTGQFVAGKSVQQRREQRQPDTQERVDKIRAKSKTGPLSEGDELDLIDSIFPDGL